MRQSVDPGFHPKSETRASRDGYPDPAGALHPATIAIAAQATIMSYVDCFALLGAVLLTAVLTVAMLCKGPTAGGAAH